ncbi:MAG: hypothetical protein QM784_32010 [Polyangiaceae bacterium]
MTSTAVLRVLALVLSFSVVACGTQSDEQSRRLNELRERLEKFQTTTGRLEERIAALENAVRAQETRLGSSTSSPTQVSAPKDLPVVKMAPPPTNEGALDELAPPENEDGRTLIVGEGNRVEARTADASVDPPKRTKEKTPATRATSKGQSNATVSGNKAP